MAAVATKREIEGVGDAVLAALRDMDAACASGLCNYVAATPWAGRKGKDEAAIVWGVTERLQKSFDIEQREHDYPGSREKCDRVLTLADGSAVWIEFKNAWRAWYFERVKHNPSSTYRSYFNGEGRSHAVSHDFRKLEQLRRCDAAYVAVVVVGFDGDDGVMANDLERLATTQELAARGWRMAADSWQTRQNAACWHRCWFWWREVPA
jgi:hypothetical protein